MAHAVTSPTAAQAAQVVPQGHTDNRTRAPGSGYAGGPTATTSKGPPADLGTGHTAAPTPGPKVGRMDFKA